MPTMPSFSAKTGARKTIPLSALRNTRTDEDCKSAIALVKKSLSDQLLPISSFWLLEIIVPSFNKRENILQGEERTMSSSNFCDAASTAALTGTGTFFLRLSAAAAEEVCTEIASLTISFLEIYSVLFLHCSNHISTATLFSDKRLICSRFGKSTKGFCGTRK